MQIVNNNRLNFPISCTSGQESYKKVEIREIDGEKVICLIDMDRIYFAFEETETIPSLIKVIEKIKRGSNSEKLIVEWVKQWGPLKYCEDQAVDDFLFEAEKFYNIWVLYRAITIRDMESIKENVNISSFYADENDLVEKHYKKLGYTHVYRFFEGKYEDVDIIGFDNKNLENLQNAAFQYIINTITPYIENGKLGPLDTKKTRAVDQDIFKVTPSFHFSNLLDVLYMKLFMLLNENNKKICPICNDSFLPKRPDKKYCSETCYNTAKNRRYRNNLKKIAEKQPS